MPPSSTLGSGSISDTVLPPLSEGFVRGGGRPVEVKQYVGSAEGFKLLMEGCADLSGLARSLKSTEKAQHPYYVITPASGSERRSAHGPTNTCWTLPVFPFSTTWASMASRTIESCSAGMLRERYRTWARPSFWQ